MTMASIERDDDRAAQARHERAHGEPERDGERRDEEEEHERDDDLGRGHPAEEEGQRADRREHDDVERDGRVRGHELAARDVLRREPREEHRLPRAPLALGGDAVGGDRRTDEDDDEVGQREEDLEQGPADGRRASCRSRPTMPPMEHMSSASVRVSAKSTHGVRARRADCRISRIQMALGSRR